MGRGLVYPAKGSGFDPSTTQTRNADDYASNLDSGKRTQFEASLVNKMSSSLAWTRVREVTISFVHFWFGTVIIQIIIMI